MNDHAFKPKQQQQQQLLSWNRVFLQLLLVTLCHVMQSQIKFMELRYRIWNDITTIYTLVRRSTENDPLKFLIRLNNLMDCVTSVYFEPNQSFIIVISILSIEPCIHIASHSIHSPCIVLDTLLHTNTHIHLRSNLILFINKSPRTC